MSRFPLWAQRLVAPAWHAGRKTRETLARARSAIIWSAAGAGYCLRENERRLAGLRGRESGKRIFILGNGPSLNRTDVDRLVGETCIASNAIFLMFERKKFRPSYYTIEDYLVAEDRRVEAAALKGCWKLFPEDVRRFIPPDELTIYLNFLRQYDGFPKFSEQFLRRVYWGGTVTFMNIQLAYYLGAANIYLVGFDHNYGRPTEKDRVQGAVITSAHNDDANHFDPRYFGAGYRWHDPKVERMEEAYRIALKFLNERGVGIYNATDGGHLEVFPRVSYDSLFPSPLPQGRS